MTVLETLKFGVLPGYRIWLISSATGTLASAMNFRGGAWEDGGNFTRAECRALADSRLCPVESVPTFDHTCGLYAMPDVEALLERYHMFSQSREYYIFGGALFWGNIVWHENSTFFRAQYGLPVAVARYGLSHKKPVVLRRYAGTTYKYTPETVDVLFDAMVERYRVEVFDTMEEVREYTEALAVKYNTSWEGVS